MTIINRIHDDSANISGEAFERLLNGEHFAATNIKFSWTPDIVSDNNLIIYRSHIYVQTNLYIVFIWILLYIYTVDNDIINASNNLRIL